ncbi:MAG: hypothetical protein AAB590_00510 [Patescibacteria group bacterium]
MPLKFEPLNAVYSGQRSRLSKQANSHPIAADPTRTRTVHHDLDNTTIKVGDHTLVVPENFMTMHSIIALADSIFPDYPVTLGIRFQFGRGNVCPVVEKPACCT